MSTALTRATVIGAAHADLLVELIGSPLPDELVDEAAGQLDTELGSTTTNSELAAAMQTVARLAFNRRLEGTTSRRAA